MHVGRSMETAGANRRHEQLYDDAMAFRSRRSTDQSILFARIVYGLFYRNDVRGTLGQLDRISWFEIPAQVSRCHPKWMENIWPVIYMPIMNNINALFTEFSWLPTETHWSESM